MEIRNNPFYELRSRLYASAAAGCGIIAEDFRLQKAMEAFKPMSEANKVFGKLYVLIDATEHYERFKKEKNILQRELRIDPMTGLYNRTGMEYFSEKLSQASSADT